MFRKSSWILVAWCFSLSFGCQYSTGRSSNAREQTECECSRPATTGVSLRIVTCKEWDDELKKYRGHYVIVDTWATWCGPCREEFPNLVKIHRRFRDHGVVVMSVSVDDPKAEKPALAFLQEMQADFPNYLVHDPALEWWDKWQIKGIPIVLVFSTEGRLLRRFDRDDPDRQFTYAEVEEYIAQLLATKNPS